MDKQEFVVGMDILKAFYLDWPFCFSEIQINVWYEYFKKYDLNKFKEIIECYISKEPSGPDNPKKLMSAYNWEHHEEWMEELKKKDDGFWNLMKAAGVEDQI